MLFGSWQVDIICLIAAIVTTYFAFARHVYTYWDRKGFKSVPNVNYLFGHFKSTFFQKESISDFILRIYKQSTEPYVGIYGVCRPVLVPRDPELIRTILVKDFAHFTDRGVHCNEDYDPLSAHLFSLPGSKWKNLRGKLTPTFTSGKLKAMFSTLVDCGSTLENYLRKSSDNNQLVDIREISASHATNVIASVAFGLDIDTISNPNNDFRKYGRQIFAPTLWNGIRLFLNFVAPKLMSFLRIKSVDNDVESFIKSIVAQNLEYREKNNVNRKDFFQLLVQLRNTGTVQLDDQWETVIKGDETQKSLTFNEIAAQSFVFFVAGFETSSSTLSLCLYELAKNPEIQKRVCEEIDRVLELHNGNITYDSVNEMKYLESCIDESLRKYPIVPMLNRTCVNDYKIPGTDHVIEKGVEIFIPALGLHRDERYYPEPEKFKPERFSEESAAGKNQLNRPYIPFGDGPRNCIGMRMGKMQTKVGLLLMLKNFKYELQPSEMNKELELDPKSFLVMPRNKINLRVFKR